MDVLWVVGPPVMVATYTAAGKALFWGIAAVVGTVAVVQIVALVRIVRARKAARIGERVSA